MDLDGQLAPLTLALAAVTAHAHAQSWDRAADQTVKSSKVWVMSSSSVCVCVYARSSSAPNICTGISRRCCCCCCFRIYNQYDRSESIAGDPPLPPRPAKRVQACQPSRAAHTTRVRSKSHARRLSDKQSHRLLARPIGQKEVLCRAIRFLSLARDKKHHKLSGIAKHPNVLVVDRPISKLEFAL